MQGNEPKGYFPASWLRHRSVLWWAPTDGGECKYIFFGSTSRTAWDPLGSGHPGTMLATVPFPWRGPPVQLPAVSSF